MIKKDNRGGARAGAGRKRKDEADKMVMVGVYVPRVAAAVCKTHRQEIRAAVLAKVEEIRQKIAL